MCPEKGIPTAIRAARRAGVGCRHSSGVWGAPQHGGTDHCALRALWDGGGGAGQAWPEGPSKATPEVMAIIAEGASMPGVRLREEVGRRTGAWLSVGHIYALAAPFRSRQLDLGETDTSAPTKLM
jgi:hypothetical protein